jgi:hypothetical protein
VSSSIKSQWAKGRYQEIFGFEGREFTALGLAARYPGLLEQSKKDPEENRIVEDCFRILSAPYTRQFFEGCNLVMRQIRKEIGDNRFAKAEEEIWESLWTCVRRHWQPPSDDLIRTIIKNSVDTVPDRSKMKP